MSTYSIVLSISLCISLLLSSYPLVVIAKPSYNSVAVSSNDDSFGSLKLCPVGGSYFMMAWGMACEMKRRKKRETKQDTEEESKFRPATLSEIMKICCHLGCEIRDLLPYCDPFGSWNSRK